MSNLILILLISVCLFSCVVRDPGGPGWCICFLLSEQACLLPCGGRDGRAFPPTSDHHSVFSNHHHQPLFYFNSRAIYSNLLQVAFDHKAD